MNFIIDKRIFAKYEDLKIGIIICKDIDNSQKNNQIREVYCQVSKQVREKFINIEELSDYSIIRKWRNIYKEFGEKKNRSSVESLIRRVVNGNEIPSINPLVDLYNIISLKYEIPCGGEDLDRINSDIELTLASGNEEFIPLGTTEKENPNVGEIIYKFNNSVICRNFNYRESELTKLTEDTTNAVLVLEYINDENVEKLEKALTELSDLVLKYLGGKTKQFILNKDNNKIEEELNGKI